MNHVANKHQQGFTLIELLLAMSFIAILLLAIALTIVQVSGMYNKGITLKEVNQVGRTINDDVRRSVASSREVVLATDYVVSPATGVPSGGRLCLGNYSYVWNYAQIASTASGITKYTSTPGGPTGPVRFLKVPDANKIYCTKDSFGAVTYQNIRAADVPQSQELLVAGDHNLGMYQFDFIKPIPASSKDDNINQQLFTIQYTIGTGDVKAMNPTLTACLDASQTNADPLYCSVQQFTLVVRSGSGV
ncbi:MAG: prepilin-type N-terminal cleavage/methylation domain-containing protein [Candidatus Microsaccharimonas sp.]